MKEESAEKTNEAESPEVAVEVTVDKVIRQHVYMSLGIGLIPIPFLDFVGVTGVQLNLMRKLAQIYNIPFSKDMVKNLIGALLGGAFPASVGPRIAFSVSKTVPGIGYALGAVSSSAVSGACTYAIGRVFSRHFSEGGTFLSFDPENARAFYEKMFQEGQEIVAEMKAQKKKQV
jgi:uncharacterized protein (DUF697 family)